MTTIQEIILNVLTEEPKTQNEIVANLQEQLVLNLSTRNLRKQFKKINEAFIDGECEWIVVSNKKEAIRQRLRGIRKFTRAKRITL